MSSWTDRVKARLKDKKMKQIDLATALNITESAVSQYLKGKRMPSVNTVRKMAKELDMSISELLGDDARFYSNKDQIQAAELMSNIPEDQREMALKVLASFSKSTDS